MRIDKINVYFMVLNVLLRLEFSYLLCKMLRWWGIEEKIPECKSCEGKSAEVRRFQRDAKARHSELYCPVLYRC